MCFSTGQTRARCDPALVAYLGIVMFGNGPWDALDPDVTMKKKWEEVKPVPREWSRCDRPPAGGTSCQERRGLDRREVAIAYMLR